MDISIRRARPSDLRRIAAIEDAGVALFEEHLGAAVLATVPALTARAASGAERDGVGTLLVAADDRRLVGFAHVVPHDLHAHLEQVSVLPSYGRRGIGARLVREAMEEARWAGFDVMSLCTYRDVPWNGPFYASLGFAEVTALEPFQRDLRAHERALGLDVAGVRVVMQASLARPGR
ncbi:GNAT family N-acetyltransferase [Nocardioides sp. 1609]|uniref:GNAT family N-acetyltransferase n=1 Tax=Nocardioides sp. 1609 TaxID=2508327 RepID=UPI00142FBDF4|nr:GNAT family N-acetyltransferase [Nocardioides sp. 1609]